MVKRWIWHRAKAKRYKVNRYRQRHTLQKRHFSASPFDVIWASQRIPKATKKFTNVMSAVNYRDKLSHEGNVVLLGSEEMDDKKIYTVEDFGPKDITEKAKQLRHAKKVMDKYGVSFGSNFDITKDKEFMEKVKKVAAESEIPTIHNKPVKEAILKIEPKIDLLHDVLGFGRFADVTMTSDGFFLGRKGGDIGYNDFLGKPSEAAQQRARKTYEQLSPNIKAKVDATLAIKGLNRSDIFGYEERW